MNKTFRVSFLLSGKSRKKKDGRIAIIYRIHLGAERMNMGSTGLSVEPELWDSKKGKVAGKSNEAHNINKQLEDIESDLRHVFRKIEFSGKLSLARIKDVYLGIIPSSVTFINYFDKYIEKRAEEVGNTLSKASLQKYNVTKRRFSEFLVAKHHKDDIEFSDLNYSIIWNFEHYLKTKAKMKNDTCMRMLRTLNTVIIHARREGQLSHDPFLGIKIQFDPPKHRFLTEKEVITIMKKQFACERLTRVRDLFIFSCFTGLAYADISKLRKDNIVEMDGKTWLLIPRQKTGILSSIPLLDIPLKIIAKYEGKLKDGRILPSLSNQRMNQYLKEIADVCGIQKTLTCHVARHTFATLAISKGVSMESTSRMLGHANLRTTRIYAAVTDDKVKREMEDMANKLDVLNAAFRKVGNESKRKGIRNDKGEA